MEIYFEVNKKDSGSSFLNVDFKILKDSRLIESFNVIYSVEKNEIYESYDVILPHDSDGLYNANMYGCDLFLGVDIEDWCVYVDPQSKFPEYLKYTSSNKIYNYFIENISNIKDELKKLYCDTMLL